MGAIWLPERKFRSPPQGRADIDWEVFSGLIDGLWTASTPGQWYGRSGRVVPTVARGFGTPDELGITQRFSPSQYIDLESPPPSASFRVGVIFKSSAVNCFTVSSRSTSSTDGVDMGLGAGGSAGSNYWRYGAASLVSATTSGHNDGQYHSYLGSALSFRNAFFADGDLVSEVNSSPIYSNLTHSQPLRIARRGSTYASADIALVLWGYSDADVSRLGDLATLLHRNPWQIFKPRTSAIFLPTGTPPVTITASGAVQGQAASVSGTATVTPASAAITSSGALQAQAATVAGDFYREITSTSTLQAQPAAVTGSATRKVVSIGALQSQAATVTGSSSPVTIHTASGGPQAQPAAVAGIATRRVTSAGASQAQPATASGAVTRTVTSVGSLQAGIARVSGIAPVNGAEVDTRTAMMTNRLTVGRQTR